MITMWVIAALLLADPSAGQGPEGLADKEQLVKLEEVWNQAHLRGDAGALAGLWAEDLVVIVPRMRIFSRADALAMVQSGRMGFERYETTDVQVRVYGEAALTTGRLRRTRVVGGNVMKDDWQFTKAYIRQQGQWRVVAFHASDAPAPE